MIKNKFLSNILILVSIGIFIIILSLLFMEEEDLNIKPKEIKRDTVLIHHYDTLIRYKQKTIIKYQERIIENKNKLNEKINYNNSTPVDSILDMWRSID